MTYLLDVNLLIALFDNHHVHHAPAHHWFQVHAVSSWATCPMTEIGFMRIVGSSSYPNSAGSPLAARQHLQERTRAPGHQFWPDDVSLLEDKVWRLPPRISSTHVADCYLVALAARHGGKLATFDRRIVVDLMTKGRESLHVLQA